MVLLFVTDTKLEAVLLLGLTQSGIEVVDSVKPYGHTLLLLSQPLDLVHTPTLTKEEFLNYVTTKITSLLQHRINAAPHPKKVVELVDTTNGQVVMTFRFITNAALSIAKKQQTLKNWLKHAAKTSNYGVKIVYIRSKIN